MVYFYNFNYFVFLEWFFGDYGNWIWILENGFGIKLMKVYEIFGKFFVDYRFVCCVGYCIIFVFYVNGNYKKIW